MKINYNGVQKDTQDLLSDLEQVDDIGELINKAHLMLEDLTNEYLGKSPECFKESDFRALLAHGYTKAQRRAHICIDYICQAAEKLQDLSKTTFFMHEELNKEKKRMLKLKTAITDLTEENQKKVKEYVEMLAHSEGVCNEKR